MAMTKEQIERRRREITSELLTLLDPPLDATEKRLFMRAAPGAPLDLLLDADDLTRAADLLNKRLAR